MTTAIVQKRNVDKKIGCMAGFFHMFDRHHILTGKKRLSPSILARNSQPETEKREQTVAPAKKEILQAAPVVELPSIRALPLAPFELKERGANLYSWRLYKEAPRLSLDSRATFDANLGSLQPREIRTRRTTLPSRRSECSEDRSETDADDLKSPSVVARLMGLELIPQSNASPARIALRRSASESRIPYKLTDADNFQDQSKNLMKKNKQSNVKKNNAITGGRRSTEATISRSDSQTNKLKASSSSSSSSSPWKAAQKQPKSFFNSADFFPEPKRCVSAYAEMEKRLRTRKMDEQFKDLEALKHIMEALQSKGLLHSSEIPDQRNKRRFVSTDEYPLMAMKPSHLLIKTLGNNSSANLRSNMNRGNVRASQASSSVSPRRPRQPEVMNSPGRKENKERIPISSVGRRSVPSQRKANEVTEQRRSVSPAHSPRLNARRNGSNQSVTRKKKQIAEDESSSISENSVSSFSKTERSKLEKKKGRKSLIERCDKLLLSIAEMNLAESQPSPVSVLDYKDDSAAPSPAMSRRTIDFKESDDETWTPAEFTPMDEPENCDFEKFTKILRASSCVPPEPEQETGKKIVIDAVSEIISRNERLPPWKQDYWSPSIKEKKAWIEFQSMREREEDSEENDVYEMVRAALNKDMAGKAPDAVYGWSERHVETAETVLDIERLIFKDLIGESIREVALCGEIGSAAAASRRRLVY